MTVTDLLAMDDMEPAALEQSLALLHTHDFYRRFGDQPEKIEDNALLAYYAAVEKLREDPDA